MLLSQVAKSTFNRTIWNTVPAYFQQLPGWLLTTGHPGLGTAAKLCTGNLKSRTLSYNWEFKLTDFNNTGEGAQQSHAKWDRSNPMCLSPQPHSSHCISSIQPTPSSGSSTEQWHFGKGHLHRVQRGTLCSNLPIVFFYCKIQLYFVVTYNNTQCLSPQKAWNWWSSLAP